MNLLQKPKGEALNRSWTIGIPLVHLNKSPKDDTILIGVVSVIELDIWKIFER